MNADFTRFGRAALWATVLLLTPSAAQAALLLPGTTVAPDILADVPVAVEASITQGFAGDDYTGSLTAAVIRNAGGTLDFYYQITNSASSTADLTRNVNSAFAVIAPPTVFTTQVFYRIDDAGLAAFGFSAGDADAAPTTADRNANGRRVGFNFGPLNMIDPGDTSRILVIRTDAIAFTNGVSTVTDGLTDPEFVGTFQPATAAAIPEPASLLLLSSAFGAAGYMARRRSRRRKPGHA